MYSVLHSKSIYTIYNPSYHFCSFSYRYLLSIKLNKYYKYCTVMLISLAFLCTGFHRNFYLQNSPNCTITWVVHWRFLWSCVYCTDWIALCLYSNHTLIFHVHVLTQWLVDCRALIPPFSVCVVFCTTSFTFALWLIKSPLHYIGKIKLGFSLLRPSYSFHSNVLIVIMSTVCISLCDM